MCQCNRYLQVHSYLAFSDFKDKHDVESNAEGVALDREGMAYEVPLIHTQLKLVPDHDGTRGKDLCQCGRGQFSTLRGKKQIRGGGEIKGKALNRTGRG